jgi:hypothetical protein
MYTQFHPRSPKTPKGRQRVAGLAFGFDLANCQLPIAGCYFFKYLSRSHPEALPQYSRFSAANQ